MAETITVVIVDDIVGTREDIKRLLYFEEDMKVVGEAGDGDEAISLAESLRPNVILMDINLPRIDGIRASEIISQRVPEAAIVIISIQGEHEYMRKAMAAGAREYLIKPFGSGELAETVRRVHMLNMKRFGRISESNGSLTQAKPIREPGEVITFFSTKGGAGKTVLACNLAVSLAQETKKQVALVDLDLQGGDVGVLLNIPARGGINELVQEENPGEPAVIKTYLSTHLSGIKVLTAPPSPEQADMILSTQVEAILKGLREEFDFIVVDTATAINDISLAAVDIADCLMVLFTQELTCLRHARVMLDILDRLDYLEKVMLMLNRVRGDEIKIKDIEKSLDMVIESAVPEDEKIFLSSINKGMPFVLSHPQNKASAAVRRLACRLAQIEVSDQAPILEENKKSLFGKLLNVSKQSV